MMAEEQATGQPVWHCFQDRQPLTENRNCVAADGTVLCVRQVALFAIFEDLGNMWGR